MWIFGGRRHIFVHTGQVNLKRGALSWFAVDPDIATALFDNAIDGCQSKTRAFADLFGGKERFENPGYRLGVHSDTRIRNSKHDIASRFGAGVVPGIGCV